MIPRKTIVGGHEIELSSHALERFRERFRQGFELEQAQRDLCTLLEQHSEMTWVRPRWVQPHPGCGAVAWAVLGEEMALPLAADFRRPGRLVATTTLARGGITHAERARRRKRKSGRRRRRTC